MNRILTVGCTVALSVRGLVLAGIVVRFTGKGKFPVVDFGESVGELPILTPGVLRIVV